MLQNIGSDLLHTICLFLRPIDVIALEQTSKILNADIKNGILYRIYSKVHLLNKLKVTFRTDDYRYLVKKLSVCEKKSPSEFTNVLHSVRGVSSVDREEEAPHHVLTMSTCYELTRNNVDLHLAQMFCGCLSVRSCYWSSMGKPSPSVTEHIDFSVKYPDPDHQCIFWIRHFILIPYKASFHPNAPVYSPRLAYLQFISEIDGEQVVYYESDHFPVEPTMSEQIFVLGAKPVLFAGGFIRICFFGCTQQQTLGEPDYFICINHAAVYGYAVTGMIVDNSEHGVCVDNDSSIRRRKLIKARLSFC